MLEILANQAAATIQLIKDKEQQRQLAVRGGLTGLYNRRAFGELTRQGRTGSSRALAGMIGPGRCRPAMTRPLDPPLDYAAVGLISGLEVHQQLLH